MSDYMGHPLHQEGQMYMDGPAPMPVDGINPQDYAQMAYGQTEYYQAIDSHNHQQAYQAWLAAQGGAPAPDQQTGPGTLSVEDMEARVTAVAGPAGMNILGMAGVAKPIDREKLATVYDDIEVADDTGTVERHPGILAQVQRDAARKGVAIGIAELLRTRSAGSLDFLEIRRDNAIRDATIDVDFGPFPEEHKSGWPQGAPSRLIQHMNEKAIRAELKLDQKPEEPKLTAKERRTEALQARESWEQGVGGGRPPKDTFSRRFEFFLRRKGILRR